MNIGFISKNVLNKWDLLRIFGVVLGLEAQWFNIGINFFIIMCRLCFDSLEP